jgi:hypothetical protein
MCDGRGLLNCSHREELHGTIVVGTYLRICFLSTIYGGFKSILISLIDYNIIVIFVLVYHSYMCIYHSRKKVIVCFCLFLQVFLLVFSLHCSYSHWFNKWKFIAISSCLEEFIYLSIPIEALVRGPFYWVLGKGAFPHSFDYDYALHIQLFEWTKGKISTQQLKWGKKIEPHIQKSQRLNL